jgi:hypothetical protein
MSGTLKVPDIFDLLKKENVKKVLSKLKAALFLFLREPTPL